MPEEVIELLKNINKNLEDIKKKQNMPQLIYVKDIVQNYRVNKNTATDFCKKYGTKFGGYCIEIDKFKEILQTKGIEIFE